MAKKDEDFEEEEAAAHEEGEEGEKAPTKGGPPKLDAGVVKLLKLVLQYVLVAIIALITTFITVKASGGGKAASAQRQSNINTDPITGDQFEQRPIGMDLEMDEMILPTADEDAAHTIKCKIIISYDMSNIRLQAELTQRKSEIHAEVRMVIGSKRFQELNTVKKQQALVLELQERISLIVQQPGIYAIYLKEFMVF